MEGEELKVGDRVKFWWNWAQRTGTVAAIHAGAMDTLYEIEEIPGCNRMLFREEISEKLKGE